jgi:hypothetical protein
MGYLINSLKIALARSCWRLAGVVDRLLNRRWIRYTSDISRGAPPVPVSQPQKKGQTILIHGGAGAVGAYAVQLASHAGATVIAIASGVTNDAGGGGDLDEGAGSAGCVRVDANRTGPAVQQGYDAARHQIRQCGMGPRV